MLIQLKLFHVIFLFLRLFDDHIKKTADDLIHLLLHKLPAILALTPESSRQALIHSAQVL